MTNRLHTVTEKIEREATGLNGALFVHVLFDNHGTESVRFSAKGKDNSTLDRILISLGDAVTSIIQTQRGEGI